VQKQFHDTVGLSTQTEPIRSVWRARPGGTATSTATFGDVTLIATSARKLIAYDLFGRWIWQAPLPDQSVVSPVHVGNVAVVATLDGSLTAIDLTNGSVAWTRRVTDSIRLQPQALNDRVVVSDLSHQLTCFSADGTRLWARDALPVSNFVIGPGTAPVVVIGDGRQATGISLADGSTLWQTPLRMSLVSMVALDGVVAVRDGNLTTGLDTASGTTEWRWDQARTYAAIGHGDRLLLLADNRLVALDSHGRQLKEWPLAVTNLGTGDVMLSTGTDRLLIWTSGAVLQGVIR
jgi:outer membrane protein assembly factor BamB